MNRYERYEKLIVERLLQDGITVSILPLTSEIDKPVTTTKIYVIFTGSTFSDEHNLGDFAQSESMSFEVYIIARTRDGEKGVFEVADETIKRLLKWKLPDTTEKITMTNFGYSDGWQNGWRYALKFTFPAIRIMREEKEDYRLITKITNEIDIKQ